MVVRLLGAADIVAAILVFLLHNELGSWRFPLIVTMYLGIKGISFYKDIQSYADIFIALYVWLIFFGFATLFDYLLIIYLLQKGIASFL